MDQGFKYKHNGFLPYLDPNELSEIWPECTIFQTLTSDFTCGFILRNLILNVLLYQV